LKSFESCFEGQHGVPERRLRRIERGNENIWQPFSSATLVLSSVDQNLAEARRSTCKRKFDSNVERISKPHQLTPK
jgi:hypothetical protein